MKETKEKTKEDKAWDELEAKHEELEARDSRIRHDLQHEELMVNDIDYFMENSLNYQSAHESLIKLKSECQHDFDTVLEVLLDSALNVKV